MQKAYAEVGKPVDCLYRELQFALRSAVGTRSIDAILENKQDIDEMAAEHVRSKMSGFGIEAGSLGVRDIVLPGDMKDILARVVEAEKSAEANVIRRREETTATRSLLNAAMVMEDNPVALQLKELETLERVAAHRPHFRLRRTGSGTERAGDVEEGGTGFRRADNAVMYRAAHTSVWPPSR